MKYLEYGQVLQALAMLLLSISVIYIRWIRRCWKNEEETTSSCRKKKISS